MQQKKSKHLTCGTLVALAHPQATINKDSVEMQHLHNCAHCEETHKYLVNYFNHVLNSKKNNNVAALDIDTCPDTDMDYLTLLLTVLNSGISKKHAANLFKHLNSCHRCFERFAIDWTAYAAVKMN